MSELFQWLIHIPETLAQFTNWLITPISDVISWTPLAILGSSALVGIGLIITFHLVHLVNPLG